MSQAWTVFSHFLHNVYALFPSRSKPERVASVSCTEASLPPLNPRMTQNFKERYGDGIDVLQIT